MHTTLEKLQQQIRDLKIVEDEELTVTWDRLVASVEISIWVSHGHAVLPKLISLLEQNAPIDKIVEDISSQMKLIDLSCQALIRQLPEVDAVEIYAIFARLVSADVMLYWEQQSDEFQLCLKTMLQARNPADEIFQRLMELSESASVSFRKLANRTGVVRKQILNSSIGCEQLVEESVLNLTNLIQGTLTIEMFSAVNQTEGHLQPGLQAAVKQLLADERLKHIMFPLGPGHWYWVTISKTGQKIPYSIEVFDPYCSSANSIYKFLDPLLQKFGIKKYAKSLFVNNGHIIPQRDGYSCGYYIAAYAHLKVKALEPNARCNDSMIKALQEHGNQNGYLRDICLHVINPGQCRKPRALQAEPRALQAKSGASQAKSQSFQLFSSKPLNSSNDWNLRGVKQAIHVTLIAEAIAIAVFFAITAGPIAIPLLLLMICAVAAASIYMSHTIEPLTYTSR